MELEPTLFDIPADIVAKISTIIGGEVSVDRRATVQVLVPPNSYCSGTVIGPRAVLTAAHCEGDVMDIEVDGQTIRAASIVPHPHYTGAYPYNDLLLLLFDQNLPGPIVDGIYSSDDSERCTELIAQGLGKSEFNEPPTLRESTYSAKESAMVLHTKQASWGGICFGDSGGPLYAVVDNQLQLAGVTSTTYTQDCLVGGDHVNLRFYRDWIEANVK